MTHFFSYEELKFLPKQVCLGLFTVEDDYYKLVAQISDEFGYKESLLLCLCIFWAKRELRA